MSSKKSKKSNMTNNDISDILSTYNNSNKKMDLELEIRLGGTGHGITKQDYERYKKNILDEMFNKNNNTEIKTEKTLSCKNENNEKDKDRITHFLDDENKIVKTKIETKNKIKDWKFKNFKLSIQKEILVSENKNKINKKNFDKLKTKCLRYKERQSIVSNDKKWQFDFTKVVDMLIENAVSYDKWIKILPNIKNKFLRYEIELEYISDSSISKEDLEYAITYVKKLKNPEEIKGDIFKPLFFDSIGKGKIPTTKPASLEKKDLNFLFSNDYAITEKADGDRRFIRISSNGEFYITESNMLIVDKFKEIQEKNDDSIWNTIIDGESYDGNFYAFNIILYNGELVSGKKLPERYELLEKVVKKINHENILVKKFYFPDKKNDLKYYAKKIWITDKNDFPYDLDGLVYTPYDPKNKEYKWKPSNMLTIDFLVKENKNSTSRYFMADLYHGADVKKNKIKSYGFKNKNKNKNNSSDFKGNYQPVKFSPNGDKNVGEFCYDRENPPTDKQGVQIIVEDNQVVEFIYDDKNPKIHQRWIPVGFRKDKTMTYKDKLKKGEFAGPNDIRSVMGNWRLIKNPVLEKDIM